MEWKLFLQGIFSEANGNPSYKRLIATYSAYVYSFVMLCAFFFGMQLSDSVIHMADVLLGTSMGTYIVGRFAEKGPSNPITPENEPKPEDNKVAEVKPVEEKVEEGEKKD